MVRSVRLGRGGFIVSVGPAEGADSEDGESVTLSTWTHLPWHGRSASILQPPATHRSRA